MKLKLRDVYHINYTEEVRKKKFESSHCFEGLAVVMESNGELILVDTFWGVERKDQYQKTFYQSDIGTKIDIEYYCNLNEIEAISHYDIDYYDDNDLIRLHRQHACSNNCIDYYKKKGSVKSTEKMKNVILNKIADDEYSITSRTRSIETLKETLKKVEAGETEGIYI